MPSLRRTHTCGELRASLVGQAVTLNGWVNTIRAYPQQVFLDLRDRYGITQVVVESADKELFAVAQDIGREFCLAVRGTVSARLPGKENPDMPPAPSKSRRPRSTSSTAARRRRSPLPSSPTRNWPTRTCACSTATWTCAGRRFSKFWCCGTR
jgi:hypothetical protein